MNVAVAAFLVAILANAQDPFKFITPELGLSLIVGIVVHTIRLRSAPRATEHAGATQPA